VLEEDGGTLWEADAIACRLSAIAKSNFWRVGKAQPDMIRWISWATHHLNRAAGPLYFFRIVWPTFSRKAPPQNEMDNGERDFRRHAAVLDAYLQNRKWLVDDEISYADFRAGTFLPYAEDAAIPLSEFPNIVRWHDQLMELEAWRTPFARM
jgi:glutathione S-transferase